MTNLFHHLLAEEEIDLLRGKLLRGEDINRWEREFLAGLIELFGHQKLSPREAAQRTQADIAYDVYFSMQKGETRDDAVAFTANYYGYSESYVKKALNKHRKAFVEEDKKRKPKPSTVSNLFTLISDKLRLLEESGKRETTGEDWFRIQDACVAALDPEQKEVVRRELREHEDRIRLRMLSEMRYEEIRTKRKSQRRLGNS
jgi:hypothetical protein